MDNQPLVSVIIIFLNPKRFIKEAIESVIAQDYENWELLLVDDGSSDDSTATARDFTNQYPDKVFYFEHPGHQNCGKSTSRNLGIANAKGEYIAFLDADDVWLPGKLKTQAAILESQPEAGMLYGLSKWWYGSTGISKDSQRDFVHELGVPADTLIRPPTLLYSFFLLQKAAIPNPSNILVRRDVATKVGGFEKGVSGLYEDQAFIAKVCLNSAVFASSTCWDLYRQHPASTSADVERRGKESAERLIFLNWLAGYLESNGFKSSRAWRLLQKDIVINRYPILQTFIRNRQRVIPWLRDKSLAISRRTIPSPIRSWLWARWHGLEYCPPVGWVRLGNLRRVTPLSQEFGYDRGKPIDRYYIEKFLAEHRQDIQGHVLEIQDDMYTHQFGDDRVEKSDVLHVETGHAGTTIVADLTSAEHIPSDTFNCIVLTQTLQFIYNVPAALQTIYRILKPDGVVLVTIPGLSPISRYDMDRWGHYWSFTSLSTKRLFTEVFPRNCVEILTYGNVLTATAFFYGLAAGELKKSELEFCDGNYELLIAVRATKGKTSKDDNSD